MGNRYTIINENQTKQIMLKYQQDMKNAKQIKRQILQLKEEYRILHEEQDEEIVGKQLFRETRGIMPQNSARNHTSRVETTMYVLDMQRNTIKHAMKDLIQQYKELGRFISAIDQILFQLPPEEYWILKEHYGNGYPMRILSEGDGDKRIQLWRLERKARRLFAQELSLHEELAWVHNEGKQ